MKPCSNWRLINFLALLMCALISTGCASSKFRTEPSAFTGQQAMQSLYVYSFLDLRENEFGPQFLAQVRAQLAAALSQKGVRSEQLSFNDSPLRSEYALTAEKRGYNRTSTRVPVGHVVAANLEKERAFGAPYRLVMFPASVSESGTGHRFDVRWEIFDTTTNQRVWSATSETMHSNWASHDENPIERGKSFVDAIIEQMTKAGVLPGRGAAG